MTDVVSIFREICFFSSCFLLLLLLLVLSVLFNVKFDSVLSKSSLELLTLLSFDDNSTNSLSSICSGSLLIIKKKKKKKKIF